jgi:short subunit dehydrogenase-like uncharacterized protein
MSEKPYDLIVLGATGFTGGLVVEYLLEEYGAQPAAFRWALAGRSSAKLKKVASQLSAELPALVADVDDLDSLQHLAQQTKVIITTVGPYRLHGSKLVQACSSAGTIASAQRHLIRACSLSAVYMQSSNSCLLDRDVFLLLCLQAHISLI